MVDVIAGVVPCCSNSRIGPEAVRRWVSVPGCVEEAGQRQHDAWAQGCVEEAGDGGGVEETRRPQGGVTSAGATRRRTGTTRSRPSCPGSRRFCPDSRPWRRHRPEPSRSATSSPPGPDPPARPRHLLQRLHGSGGAPLLLHSALSSTGERWRPGLTMDGSVGM